MYTLVLMAALGAVPDAPVAPVPVASSPVYPQPITYCCERRPTLADRIRCWLESHKHSKCNPCNSGSYVVGSTVVTPEPILVKPAPAPAQPLPAPAKGAVP